VRHAEGGRARGQAHRHPSRAEERRAERRVPRRVTSVRAAIITASTRGAAGERADESGPAMRDALTAAGHAVAHAELVPDDIGGVATAILRAVRAGANVVLT